MFVHKAWQSSKGRLLWNSGSSTFNQNKSTNKKVEESLCVVHFPGSFTWLCLFSPFLIPPGYRFCIPLMPCFRCIYKLFRLFLWKIEDSHACKIYVFSAYYVACTPGRLETLDKESTVHCPCLQRAKCIVREIGTQTRPHIGQLPCHSELQPHY